MLLILSLLLFLFYAALFKMPPVGGKSNMLSKVNQFALGILNVDCSIVSHTILIDCQFL